MSNQAKVYFEALSKGERGTMVYIAQKLLHRMGYDLKMDGIFSDSMEKIVKKFQATKEALVEDGVIGYQTMKEMDEASILI